MRIHLLCTEFDPLASPGGTGWSGRGAALLDLAQALTEAGHEVGVIGPRGDRERPRAGRAPVVHDFDPSADVPRALAEIWAAEPPDVVHAWDIRSGVAAVAGGVTEDAPLVQSLRTPRDAPVAVRDAMLRRADRVVATSTAQQDELLRRGARRDRIRVVPPGVDIGGWSPDGPSLRRGERSRIVLTGSLEQAGGADDAVVALRGVPDSELYVAGGPAPGGSGDTDLVRLQTLAARTGVANRVRFLGAVPRADLGRLLRSADVVIGPSRVDVAGTAMLEAMACGRPVVATAVGGQRDIVVDGVTGLLVRPARPAELGTALRAVLADPAAAQGYGIAGRDRIGARYCRTRAASAMLDVYDGARDRQAAAEPPDPVDPEPVAAG